jgi:hypothetical protein
MTAITMGIDFYQQLHVYRSFLGTHILCMLLYFHISCISYDFVWFLINGHVLRLNNSWIHTDAVSSNVKLPLCLSKQYVTKIYGGLEV